MLFDETEIDQNLATMSLQRSILRRNCVTSYLASQRQETDHGNKDSELDFSCTVVKASKSVNPCPDQEIRVNSASWQHVQKDFMKKEETQGTQLVELVDAVAL